MTHEGSHDGTHEGCFACKIRTVHLSPAATPTRRKEPRIRPMKEPSWEKGVAGTNRPDGSFVPFVDAKGNDIGVKQYADNRGRLDAIRKEQASKVTN